MDKQFIIAAQELGTMDQFVSYRKQIGAKSIEFPKYSNLALATSPLSEKEDPASVALVDSQILLTPAEYGNVVTPSKLASLQSGGIADLAAARLVGINMQSSLDKLAILAAEAGGNEIFPGTVTAEANLVGTDVMTTSFLNRLYNKLSRSKIAPLSNGMYVIVLHPDVVHDLRDSTGAGSFSDITKYSRPEEVLKGEIGMLAGFRIIENANISINADAGSTTVDSYHCLAMGFNALGKAVSAEPGMKITGPFDKLGRYINIGWTGCLKYGLVDTDSLWVGTVASSVGANT